MAGQQLERAVKERIGSTYLKGLLTNLEATPSPGLLLADFHATLRERSGIGLPDVFSELFGLDNLQFRLQEVDSSTLPQFYTGRPREQRETPTIQNSTFTLEVAQRVDLDNFPPEFETKSPMFVRIAGIDQATNRIVAATYDAETGEILIAAVSIGDDKSNPPYSEMFTVHVKNQLLTDVNSPYATPGFVTETMIQKTAADRSTQHTEFLVARLPYWESAIGGLKDARVNVTKTDSELTIESVPYLDRKTENAWKITLPRRIGIKT